jgi:hypothetical protein
MATTVNTSTAPRKRIAGWISAALLGVFLVAGWWPFHAPKNGASWLENGAGIRLRNPSTLLSSTEFRGQAVLRTIEIWLQPSGTDEGGAILAFQTKPAEHFYLSQSESDLELQWPAGGYRRHYLYVPGIFHRDKAVLITLVSGERGVAVYVDGALKKTRRGFRFSASELAGRLVVGATPSSDSCWSGQLRGLAMYDREFSPREVGERFANWTTTGRPGGGPDEGVLALYLFDERAGSVAHDKGRSHFDLVIPPRFELLNPTLLHPFWRESRFSWGDWKDVLLNLFGFLPFGFLLCAYFSATRPTRAAIGAAVLCGFFVSLTIEVVQVYLPTRCSDSRDLLTNTLGTLWGATIYAYQPVRSIYETYVDRLVEILNTVRRAPAVQCARSRTEVAPRVAPD